MNRKPHRHGDISVAGALCHFILVSDKTQARIAEEAGFTSPNIIAMMKHGRTKVPLDKIEPLARALDVDPTRIMALVLSEYHPDLWSLLDRNAIGKTLTPDEIMYLRAMRLESIERGVPLEYNENRAEQLRQLAGQWVNEDRVMQYETSIEIAQSARMKKNRENPL